MKRRLALLALPLLLLSVNAFAQTPAPAAKPIDIAGKWAVSMEISMGNSTPTLVLKQDGEKVTGTYTGRYGEFQLAGTLKDKALQFTVALQAEGQTVSMFFNGEVAADGKTITKGAVTIEGLSEGSWTAKRSES